jgi:invasion protein IalB
MRGRPSARALGIALAGIILTLAGRCAADTISPLKLQQNAAQLELVFSPWTKSCLKQEEANVHLGCLIAKNGRTASGSLAVAAVLIEPPGESRKILRVTLPLEMQLPEGTRIMVDQGQSINAPYISCVRTGCIADYEASKELIDQLKRGQGLVVEGINSQGQVVSFVLPLFDFAKAYDGPPTDSKSFEEQP